MKSMIAPILATASFATIVVCSLAAASSLTAPYTPHQFKHVDASIWSDTPVHVDQKAQSLERLAAVTPISPPNQAFTIRDPLDVQKPPLVQDETASSSAIASNVVACQERYRSYRAEDNTYQPLDGGPRKQCAIGASEAAVATAKEKVPPEGVADNVPADHSNWCSSRYSSYDPSNDTYQPFGGGARRQCMSPVGMASNG